MNYKPGDKVIFKYTKDDSDEGVVMQIRTDSEYCVGVEWGNGTFAWFAPDELYLDTDVKDDVPSLPVPPKSEKDKQREFFFGPKREHYGISKSWKDAGLCPDCGEEGRIHLSTFICSKHGVY